MESVNALLKPDYHLKPWQEKLVKYALTHHYCINASGMGVGKTLASLAVAYYHQRNKEFPVLVVCPAGLITNWEAEIERTSISPDKIKEFLVISYNNFKANYPKYKNYPMVIFDEAHALKNIDAKVTQAAHTFLETYQPDVALFLTGTPIKNRIPELYSLLCLCAYNKRKTSGLDVIEEYSFYEFQNRFCYVEMKKFAGRKVRTYYGLKNKDLLKTLLKDKYIRFKSEVLGLDKPIIKHIQIEYPEGHALQKAWEEHNKDKSKGGDQKAQAAYYVAPFTTEYCDGLLDSGVDCLVIFSCHVNSAEHIAEHYGKKCRLITGKTSVGDRNTAISDFQNGKVNILVLTVGTSSTGLNLQRANHCVFNDVPWVPEDLSQAMARIDRQGQKRQTFFHFMEGGKIGRHITDNILNPKIKTIKEFHDE